MAFIPANSFTFLYEISLSTLKASQIFFTPNTHVVLDKIVRDTIYMLINIIENKQKHKSNRCSNILNCTLLKLENILEFINNVNKLFNTTIKTNTIFSFNIWMNYYKIYWESFTRADTIIYNVYYKPYNICIPENYFKMITSATESIIKQYDLNYQHQHQQHQQHQQQQQQYLKQYYQYQAYQYQAYQQEQMAKQAKQKDAVYANTNLDINDSSDIWNPFVNSIVKNVFDNDDNDNDNDDIDNDNDIDDNDDNDNEDDTYINETIIIEDNALNQITKRRYRKRGGRRVREQRERKQNWIEMQKRKELENKKGWTVVQNHKKMWKKYHKKC